MARNPERRVALTDAAIEVLNESGWAAFTTTAVARRAGASTASLYRRWPSKQALAGAVARHIALDGLGGIDTGSLEATSANCSPPSAASWRTPPAPRSSP
ncbi:hypothetical protein DDE05_33985 [Streptomyces cavourensis]|nr:hypothetical protein DDE05_33985 [Streptomyces cavourensis]